MRQLIRFETEWSEEVELKNDEDEDDDIKLKKVQKNDDAKQTNKKRKLSIGDGDYVEHKPPIKKIKVTVLNNEDDDRVFGVAMPPHLASQT